MRKINGNQITLLTERLKGQCVKFTGHPLSFKTFHFFYYLSLLLFIAASPERFLTQSVALHLSSAEPSISATSQTRSGTLPVAVSHKVLGPVPEVPGDKADSVNCIVT